MKYLTLFHALIYKYKYILIKWFVSRLESAIENQTQNLEVNFHLLLSFFTKKNGAVVESKQYFPMGSKCYLGTIESTNC